MLPTSRPRSSICAGGPKQQLREAGIDLSVNYTEFYQGLVEGKGNHGWEFGGKTDIIANFDGGRMGLWPGLYVNIHAEFINGSNVLEQGDGSILPVNTALAFPTLGGYDEDLSVVVTQAFSESTTLSVGKFNMLDAASKTPLLGGGGLTTFMNVALAAPVSGVTPPYIVGAILSHKTEPASYTLMVYDPRNAQDWDVVSDPFSEGVTTSLSVTVPVSPGGLRGYQNFRGVYSTASGTDFEDIPDLLLPPQARDIDQLDGYWFGSYSFQQYLVQDPNDPRRGWGVFGQIAVSDGNPNPIGWSALIGLGGTGLLASRPDDSFGIAYFYDGFSEDLKDGLGAVGFDLGDESGVEAFYNIAATPWLNLTADVQAIEPGAGDETAWFVGFRAMVKVF
jgi:porin